MENNPQQKSINKGIMVFMALSGMLVLIAVAVMLPYRLYQHDTSLAEIDAANVSKLLTTSILSTMIRTGRKEDVRSLMRELKSDQNFEFRIYRSKFVEKQFGMVEGEQPTEGLVMQVFEEARPRIDYPKDTTLRYLTPLITDQRCKQCHVDLDGKPISEGVVMGVYETAFDLSDRKARSIKLIIHVALFIMVILAISGLLLYKIIVGNVVEPIRQLTYVITGWDKGDYDRTYPEPRSRELGEITALIRRIGERLRGSK